jgi:hypothetical protein
MFPLTLQQLFGVNAIQNGQTLIINKSDLPLLMPVTNNTAESLLVAILLKALSNFSGNILDSNNQPILDSNNQPITFDNSEAYELLKVITWQPYQIIRSSQPYVINQIIIFTYATI